jgi:hypothetical protein
MAQLPVISYKEFFKNPIVGILFICISAIGYLYIDNRTNYQDQVVELNNRLTIAERRIEIRDSIIFSLSNKITQLEVLNQHNNNER